MTNSEQEKLIYYLHLEETGQPKINSDQILTAEKNSILHLELPNGTSITKEIALISNAKQNFPFSKIQNSLVNKTELNREEFSSFIYPPIEVSTSLVYEISLDRTGPVQFCFIYNDENNHTKVTTPFFVIIQPHIIIQNKHWPINSINLQTVLSKSLGKINDFKKYYEEAKLLHYNFVHFTPIQKLGLSDSLYCWRDNTQINDVFFSENNWANDEKLQSFKTSIDECRDKYGVGSIVDIVWNHAADNSEWLGEHPECGYNLVNTPWLNCAYSLDKTLMEFSDKFAQCKTKFKFQPYVHNESEWNEVVGELKKIVGEKNLFEYFMIDVEDMKKNLNVFYDEYKQSPEKYQNLIDPTMKILNENSWLDFFNKHCLDKFGESRKGVIVIIDKYTVNHLNYNKNISKSDFIKKTEIFMNQSNANWINQSKSMLDIAIENIRCGIRYEFIEMKNKAIIRDKPLIGNYFAVFDKNDKSKIFACNGWIMESDDKNEPTPNFTKKNSYYYYKRKVMIWSDCPKWNYGISPDDCPYLLTHMTKYVQDMAKIFNGFRLDNAHSTPIFVAEYLAMKAREVNPDLLIIAELFTTKENEVRFVNHIGINLLIRELIWCYDANGVSSQIHRFGGGSEDNLGQLEEQTEKMYKDKSDSVNWIKMKYLLPHLPKSVIYDLTHDNETYHQKLNNLSINLTNMACCSFASAAIGSTRGYDQLFPYKLEVVKENRWYEYDNEFKDSIQLELNEEEKQSAIVGENVKQINENDKKDVKIEEESKEEKITFEYIGNNISKVDLAISSNNWKPDIHLVKIDGKTFRIEITLQKGQRYFYKYVINEKDWIFDKNKPNLRDNSGNINNYIDVGIITQEEPKFNPSIDNSKKKSYHVKDLKIFRRELNIVRSDWSRFKNEIYLSHNGNYISIFRNFVNTPEFIKSNTPYDGYVMICRTGFDGGPSSPTEIELPGIYSEFVCGCSMKCGRVDVDGFKRNNILSGTKSEVYLTKNSTYLNSITKISNRNNKTIIEVNSSIQSNTVIILRYKLPKEVSNSLNAINNSIQELYKNWEQYTDKLDMGDINLILYKCENEENDNTNGKRGNYNINNWGSFVYAGIGHIHKMCNEFKISKSNHPILDNIRSGDWLLKYTVDRLADQSNIKDISVTLNKMYNDYTKLYTHYKPLYFTKIIDTLYNIIMWRIVKYTSNTNLINFSSFSQSLIKSIYQYIGYIESSKFKYGINPMWKKWTWSAGLPHFSREYTRCWGRDTFIAFKGLLLIPGYYQEAKEIILDFAMTMRHGLIPNLLDTGNNPRYNARDATWFFMQSIVDYIELSRDIGILDQEVSMIFLSDNFEEHNIKKSKGETKRMFLYDIVNAIFSSHAKGINFREWRAGKQIDEQMKDEGFNIKIYLNWSNGFIYGGNKSNCGTWMDKMGSSEKAGNKGCPATPRNGADIEIIGLLYSTLCYFNKWYDEGQYKYNYVLDSEGKELTLEKWSELIKANFDDKFYIDKKPQNNIYENIYKDYLSDDNDIRHESQLRPNLFVTMAIAPELFVKDHALKCIREAEKYWIVKNCVGIRTLDNRDKNYNGNYINTDDSNNYLCAHGFNYHNGPEWVWPMGYYLLSIINFNECKDKEELFMLLCEKMKPFEKYIKESPWQGLPEWTNKDGSLCPGSCTTQAWSIGTIIEALEKLCEIKESVSKN